MPFPKIEGYVVTEKLGSGSYSTVYKAYTKVGARSIVAVKCVDKSRIKNSGTAVDNLITEIRLLKTLSHPHIVHMKHFTWDDRNIYIIMEYCCGGDLSKYIQRYGRVAEKQVLYFLQQLASALKFLREKGVVHMDLKPHNLLLHKGSDGKYTLKVGDFGFAQHMQSSCSGTRGSPLYMAPEVLAGTYDARADLWSVGVIMYECLFGKAPYSSNTFKELVDKIQKQAKIEIPPNSSISAGCRDLLTRLLKHDPDERISYEEFFNHDYLDLEHMPSKENYEKAVRLMSCAVELDGSARAGARDGTRRVVLLRESLRAYREALRYLVPCAGAETDAVRRAALTDKLTRYMERAEEIKEYLKCVDQNIPPSVPPMGATSFGNTDPTSTCSYTYGNTEEAVCPSNSRGTIDDTYRSNTNGVTSATTVHSARDMELVEEKRRAIQAVEASKASDRPRTPPRFGLKRLFGRQTAVPHLNSNDSSLADNSSKEKIDTQDGPSDGCRIT